MRAARGRVWRQLVETAQSATVAASVQREVDAYLARLGTLAFAHYLPCVSVDLRRLVVVPRVFVNGHLYRGLDIALQAHSPFAGLDDGEPLRHYFVATLVNNAAAVVERARPSVRHPLSAGADWIAVGVNNDFEWRAPFEGAGWPGHYFVMEVTRRPITRAVRKAAAHAIGGLEASLPSLTRASRFEILRQAGLTADRLVAQS
jgi:hypothetical protein